MRQVTASKEFMSATGVVRLVILGETELTYLVCSPEEFESSRRERRDPRSLGFRKSDVVTRGKTATPSVGQGGK